MFRQVCFGGILLVAMLVIRIDGGFPGIFCGVKNKTKALAGCSNDCQTAHNSASGKCGYGKDYNCYCDGPRATVNNRSVQCLDSVNPTWVEICTLDCQCDHGALGGECNFETRGCTCFGSAAGFQENRCPFKNGDELLTWFNATYTSVGMGKFAAALLAGAFAS